MGVMGALFVRRKGDFFLNDFKYFHIRICGSLDKIKLICWQGSLFIMLLSFQISRVFRYIILN